MRNDIAQNIGSQQCKGMQLRTLVVDNVKAMDFGKVMKHHTTFDSSTRSKRADKALAFYLSTIVDKTKSPMTKEISLLGTRCRTFCSPTSHS